jgi:hypothetical protein
MSEYLKVKDRPDLVRDMHSKAILNKDVNALNKYREERDFKLRLANVVEEHNNLKKDVSEIKDLLTKILERIQ